MAWESGFFNSVNGDRVYGADKFNEIFEGLMSNGVFESVGDKLAVSPNTGMAVQVGTGRGWFNNHWVKNSSNKIIALEGSDNVLNRYAAIIVRVNSSDGVRDVECTVKYSDYDSSPAKPEMTRTELINEYCLAYVYIRAKSTSITASDIEDTRSNSNLCGWVTGLVEQLSADTLYTQFTAIFNTWFQGLVDTLDENTEAMLVNALPTNATITLTSNGWTGSAGNYTQVVEVSNMSATKTVIVEGAEDLYYENNIVCTGQGANQLTFSAKTRPNEDITVKVAHMGV